jgi:hypothetical protein
LLKSPDPGVSDEEYARTIEAMIHDEVVAGWELVRQTAETALAKNPHDDTARFQLLGYEQWKRQQALPEKKRAALVIAKKPKAVKQRCGVWARASDGRWYIRIRAGVGDVVKVKRADGTSQMYRLTEPVALNLWKGVVAP